MRKFNTKRSSQLIALVAAIVFLLTLIAGWSGAIPLTQAGGMPQLSEGRALVGAGIIAASIVTGVIGWFGAVINFIVMIGSKRKDVEVRTLAPLHFSVLTADYLNADGLSARSRLIFFLALFLSAISTAFASAEILTWSA